jgi:hypothetical protein
LFPTSSADTKKTFVPDERHMTILVWGCYYCISTGSGIIPVSTSQ